MTVSPGTAAIILMSIAAVCLVLVVIDAIRKAAPESDDMYNDPDKPIKSEDFRR